MAIDPLVFDAVRDALEGQRLARINRANQDAAGSATAQLLPVGSS